MADVACGYVVFDVHVHVGPVVVTVESLVRSVESLVSCCGCIVVIEEKLVPDRFVWDAESFGFLVSWNDGIEEETISKREVFEAVCLV